MKSEPSIESFIDQSKAAFNRALRTGRLTEANVSDYMFMGFNSKGQAEFKHIVTRKYLPH